MAVAFCQQRRMGAALNDLPIVKHQNFVGVLHSGKAVGDHQDRLFLRQLFKGKLYLVFVLRVREGGGLIQNDDRRVLQNGPCQRDALVLAAGEIGAAAAHHGIKTVGEPVDDLPALRGFGGAQDLFPRGVRPGGTDIFQQGVLEELRVLKDKGNLLYQGLLADLPNINAANQNTALSCIIKAGNELRCGGFAAAGSAY